MKEENKPIMVSKEIIWHLTCGNCHFYWTIPTMSEDQDISNREWSCPLCAQKSYIEMTKV